MKLYPALDVRTASSDLLLALVDDFAPVAVEERGDIVRVFFSTASARDAAQLALAADLEATAVEISDEDWARRSQENLAPITVGRITVFPSPQPLASSPAVIAIVIVPSMGFGTGHHVTTRLCLAALQALDLNGLEMLDVGTGSGVLAIAADRLGAALATGIDYDPDAIQSARENLPLNADARHVTFDLVDLTATALLAADVVTANLTGALLVRSAPLLLEAVRPGGHLILSGILAAERDEVVRAMAPAAIGWEREEDGWVGLTMKKPWQSTEAASVGSNT
jgi:ribosomal protein L11 methyltransferase